MNLAQNTETRSKPAKSGIFGVMFYKKLKMSLKHRPEIIKLIMKMRQCIIKRNKEIKKLRLQLKEYDYNKSLSKTKHSHTQTDEDNIFKHKDTNRLTHKNKTNKSDNESQAKDLGWAVDAKEGTKSIADQVMEVAQSVVQESGMVYVESAGMYYDYKTGYYYNPELKLYYHTDTGCYYTYLDDNKTFVFHSYPDRSSVNAPLEAHMKKKAKKQKKDEEPKAKRKKRNKKSEKKKLEKEITDDTEDVKEANENVPDDTSDLEDGECSITSESGDDDNDDNEDGASTSTASDDESVSKHHPPCMRMIVRETSLPKLKVGSLFLITKDGGTIGREGDHHSILLKDQNVSRNHLEIQYNTERRGYFAVDFGSKNGTLLNGLRMSPSQEASTPTEIVHGSMLQLGETKLLCHIHPGTDTCGHCEPGLIMETQEKEKKVAYTRTCSVQIQHQLELARLKNKYAPKLPAIDQVAYNDRAQARREKVGSSHSSEKTQSADVNTYIEPENKGFKLLEKMGWSKGEGLGKDKQGDVDPIPLVSNEGKSGLGAPPGPELPKGRLGPATLKLAARTKMLHPPAKAFQAEPEDDSE
ncbi:angiogenic factor with G patch and FHA domains 1 isoform X2 [Leptidea sinapis]|uniref:angiogenic factor with G patch and FHA domains 1 isoform X2 n=1 Tax=Leptidea sinapis TaxID=189913 RepID=UPI0021C40263|nr:angiogenic factor with G patch and FHA domains 1 isoform X2 [Leptidea sinapis]